MENNDRKHPCFLIKIPFIRRLLICTFLDEKDVVDVLTHSWRLQARKSTREYFLGVICLLLSMCISVVNILT